MKQIKSDFKYNKIEKEINGYFKSLFHWRWIFPIIFIILTSIVITMGFYYEDPINPIYFKNKVLWYGGNFIFWFIFDFIFGLGQVNYWERKNKQI